MRLDRLLVLVSVRVLVLLGGGFLRPLLPRHGQEAMKVFAIAICDDK